jgi:hypothetical protein
MKGNYKVSVQQLIGTGYDEYSEVAVRRFSLSKLMAYGTFWVN